jgi:hypothetical protein
MNCLIQFFNWKPVPAGIIAVREQLFFLIPYSQKFPESLILLVFRGYYITKPQSLQMEIPCFSCNALISIVKFNKEANKPRSRGNQAVSA